ncbi:MAG: M42 family metallopeptidase [Candidatus Auribacterota bacterium]|nr:M42 family metallopeptidase [Candidatus Auribacterota bacterium]
MRKESFDFLKRLINTVSPSGFEEEAVRVWRDRTKSFADEVKTDILGNSIAVLNKTGNPKIMLAGHIDEIGFMVKYINKEGYIYFSTIGGVDLHLVPGQRVWVKTKKDKVLGVIGKKPVHLLEEEEKKKVAKIEQFWIDIGAKDEKEAKAILNVGDSIVPAVGLEILNNDIVVGRGFDDKAGAFVISETLRILSRRRPKVSLYGVATVQEEIGLRGAKASAYGISPDIGIAIDVTFATDFPSMDKKKTGDIKIGKGPVIARGPNINPKIFDLLVEAAKKEKIPYQVEGIPKATGTDANVIQLTKGGVAAGLVSIPNRYMHTQVELINLKDLENASRLLSAFILRLDKDINLVPH